MELSPLVVAVVMVMVEDETLSGIEILAETVDGGLLQLLRMRRMTVYLLLQQWRKKEEEDS